ncbi:TadE/TadG family type IV pilus assembly protein [Methylobacterium sp. 77]|uniref:TadE/TadG family type IV pilus assembly protein n=1 Tax=Methylobacterium sp. 77 TaxID=1101192 RepID=UPI00035EFCF3|nr:TadE/TadG family type IV pilus assembly protein [Methylobacterium sp. 77]
MTIRSGAGLLTARLRKLSADRRGATAVEFGLVGLPFVLLVGAMLEAFMFTIAQTSFDNALDRAGRAVFTGTFQQGADSTDPAARLIKEMCKDATYFNCSADKIKIEVTAAGMDDEPVACSPYDATSQTISSSFGKKFQCPNGDDIVSICATAAIPRYFPTSKLTLPPLPNNEQMIRSMVVFRAEPYAQGKCQSN